MTTLPSLEDHIITAMGKETQEKCMGDEEAMDANRLIQYVDEGVREVLPGGTQVHGISPSGFSPWAKTAKIDATNQAGEETPFFIKVHKSEHGKDMVKSEFKGMKMLRAAWGSELVAEPVGYGEYKKGKGVWFFICHYYELSGGLPDVKTFPALIAKMHNRPDAQSRTGEFGLGFSTYGGRNLHRFPFAKTWKDCFYGGLALTFEMEKETHGPDAELDRLREGILNQVVPRLLGPLETEGRTITPVLIHGDLWDGNASVNADTGKPIIFDATPLYAHNEYELAPWWAKRHKMTHKYIDEYIKHYPRSEPVEDFEDRGALYSLRFDLHASSLRPGDLEYREIAMNTMRGLCEKYVL
ncbi:protein-ribulosamine 3-kinase, chloroplastic [Podospora conica]|nr:protein-ribulosamine 3-kinase, chloroplastic [Schizothecium conicum]